MEIERDSESDFSESDLSDEEVAVNAYGSPIRTVNRAHHRETTVTGAVAAPSTSDANSNPVARIRSNETFCISVISVSCCYYCD